MTASRQERINLSTYAGSLKISLATTNNSGYRNKLGWTSTASNNVLGPRIKESLATGGADGSSKAEINIARYDIVPLIRFEEDYAYFGIKSN